MKKPTVGIKSIKLKLKNCRHLFGKDVPIFSKAFGSWEEFGFSNYWNYQRHFYLMGWCILTVRGVMKNPGYKAVEGTWGWEVREA